jgi:heterodisulfide reductase subunit A-like polyferredoxin
VERVATWASPTAQVVVTADRLLWLLDDAVANRVRSLDWRHVRAVSHRLRRPLRRTAVVRVDATSGRRFEFAELRPQAALGLAQDIAHAAGLDPAAARRGERRPPEAVVVVGAGPAGLGVAAELRRRGHDAVVLERDRVFSSWRRGYRRLELNSSAGSRTCPGAASAPGRALGLA